MAASAVGENAGTGSVCQDFALFQELLRNWRKIDDRIVNALNSSVLTDSFKQKVQPENACKQFYDELVASHKKRDDMIKTCVKEISLRVGHLQELKNTPNKTANGSYSSDDQNIISSLRKEQKVLKQVQQELNVEEIIQDRSLKAYYERCRLLYTPEDFSMT